MYFEVRETQSRLGTSRTGYLVGLGTNPTRYRSDWYPVTQSGTGTGASLMVTLFVMLENSIITLCLTSRQISANYCLKSPDITRSIDKDQAAHT